MDTDVGPVVCDVEAAAMGTGTANCAGVCGKAEVAVCDVIDTVRFLLVSTSGLPETATTAFKVHVLSRN